jgi:hypothetical protein
MYEAYCFAVVQIIFSSDYFGLLVGWLGYQSLIMNLIKVLGIT